MTQRSLLSLMMLTVALSLWTMAPYGGCACQNPYGPSSGNVGPSPTPTPTHGPTLDTFEGGSNQLQLRFNAWGGGYNPGFGPTGTKTSLTYEVASDAAFGVGSMHFYGYYGVTVTPGFTNVPSPCFKNPYPFVDIRVYTTPFGDTGREDLTRYGTGTGVRFWAKSNTAPSNSILLKVLQQDLVAYTNGNPAKANAYHFHNKVVSISTVWTKCEIPFSQLNWGGSWAAACAPEDQPINGYTYTNTPVSATAITAIQFEPNNWATVGAAANGTPYDIYIDQLEIY